MITNFKNFNLITENPDTCWEGDISHYVSDRDARPFFITPTKGHANVKRLFVGNLGSYHSDLQSKENFYKQKFYPGRMWVKSKIITFWIYPSEELFKKIIDRIQRKLKIKMYNNGWRIEVFMSDKKEIRKGGYDPKRDEYNLNYECGKMELVPLEDYAGSEDVPEEVQIMHLMNWKEKELAKQAGKLHFGKWGSAKTAWDQPHNIKYRQAIYQEKNNNNL